MKDNLCELVLILDESGSMGPVKRGTLEGINSFIREQKTLPGKANFTLVYFNEKCRLIHNRIPLKDVTEISDYAPNFTTALYDTVCKTIDGIGACLSRTPERERPSKVIFGIMTDGMENDSHKHTFADMKSRISHQTDKYNWKFVFLGASLDECATMRNAGVSKDLTLLYDAKSNIGVTRGYGAMSYSIKKLRQ